MKENLRVADRVRRAINRLNTSSELMARAWFECFDNCREQGYVLTIWHPTLLLTSHHIAFSENRNSDEIVVYCYKEKAHPSNLPATAAGWNDKQCFLPHEVDSAALYILRRASKFLTPNKK